jgi:hypothetical protein
MNGFPEKCDACAGSTSIRPPPLPSKFFSTTPFIDHPTFEAVWYRYWQCRKINHKIIYNNIAHSLTQNIPPFSGWIDLVRRSALSCMSCKCLRVVEDVSLEEANRNRRTSRETNCTELPQHVTCPSGQQPLQRVHTSASLLSLAILYSFLTMIDSF